MTPKSALIQGTLDMLVLRVLERAVPHGWGITEKLEQLSRNLARLGKIVGVALRGHAGGPWRLPDMLRRRPRRCPSGDGG